jgi:hypothetical protein
MAPSSISEWYGYNHGASLGCGWDRRVVYLTWRQMIIVDLGTQSGLVDINITTSDTNTDPVRFYVLYPTTDVWSNAQLLSGMYFNANNTFTYYYNYNPAYGSLVAIGILDVNILYSDPPKPPTFLITVTCPVRYATVLTVSPALEIQQTSAALRGNVTDEGTSPVTQRGICWDVSPNPSLDVNLGFSNNGTGPGLFTTPVTGLTPYTTYYFRAYAINGLGYKYGDNVSFTTIPYPPSITTVPVTVAVGSTVGPFTIYNTGGRLITYGTLSITEAGIVFGITSNPTVDTATKVIYGAIYPSNRFGVIINEEQLIYSNTLYYVRAYLIDSSGTAIYGNQVTFVSAPFVPTVVTLTASNVAQFSLTASGSVIRDNGSAVSQRGICWSTNPNPTTALTTKIVSGSGLGAYSVSITSLTPSTTYYIRAYAINSQGTAYGDQVTQITGSVPPSVSIYGPVVVTDSSATLLADNSSGSTTVTSRGFSWSLTNSPLPSNTLPTTNTQPGGTGEFRYTLTGLPYGTTYYYRAWAINSIGLAYNNSYGSFTTLIIPPVVVTGSPSVTINEVCKGIVTGSATITTYGSRPIIDKGFFMGNTSTEATVVTNIGQVSLGAGSVSSFSGTFPTLYDSPKTYYIRAYVQTSAGIFYGTHQPVEVYTTVLALHFCRHSPKYENFGSYFDQYPWYYIYINGTYIGEARIGHNEATTFIGWNSPISSIEIPSNPGIYYDSIFDNFNNQYPSSITDCRCDDGLRIIYFDPALIPGYAGINYSPIKVTGLCTRDGHGSNIQVTLSPITYTINPSTSALSFYQYEDITNSLGYYLFQELLSTNLGNAPVNQGDTFERYISYGC